MAVAGLAMLACIDNRPLPVTPATCFDRTGKKRGRGMSVSASSLAAMRPTVAQSRKAIYAATIGNVMEWYDFGVFGFLAGSLALNFFPKDDPRTSLLNTFLIFGVGLIFRPLGGIVIGRLGDRRGRKPALVLTILLMAVGTDQRDRKSTRL